MAEELQKQQSEQPAIWRQLYQQSWEQAFMEFLHLLATQYRLELTVELPNGQHQPDTALMGLWREGLKELSPSEILKGLMGYLQSEKRSFPPQPGDICEHAPKSHDRPKVVTDPNCRRCSGSGWEVRDHKAYRCDCRAVEYRGEVYADQPRQLAQGPAKPDEVPCGQIVAKAASVVQPMPSDMVLDFDRNAEKLRQQAEQLLRGNAK